MKKRRREGREGREGKGDKGEGESVGGEVCDGMFF